MPTHDEMIRLLEDFTRASRRRLPPWMGGLCLLSLIALSLPATGASAAGRIEGYVYDAQADRPLAFTNIQIVGSTMGAMSQDDGGFTIASVPPGTYEIRASYVGYEPVSREIEIAEGETLRITFRMKATEIRAKEVTIRADRPLVDVKRASTMRTFNAEELNALALQPTLDSVVEQVPGVTKDNNRLHIRGGRADETLYIVDGVKTRDLLSGETQGEMVGTRSVAEVNIITGGFDAKYGQALSGIIEAKLKEGTEDWHGYFGYTTDYLLDDQNLGFYEFELSGPLRAVPDAVRLLGVDDPGKMKFFLSLSANLYDGWLPSISDLPGDKHLRSSYNDRLFGDDVRYERFFYPRANNNWRFLFKSSWRATTSDKFDVSFTKSLSFNQGFGDTEVGDINRNITNYPYNWARRFDHYYTVSKDLNTFSLVWHRGISTNLVHKLGLTRFFTAEHRDVRGKLWTEYDTSYDSDSLTASEDTPYFRDVGDASDYRDRFVKTWELASEWTYTYGRHKLDWGASHQIEDVQYLSLDTRTVVAEGPNPKPLGDEFDLFHVYPSSGALYLQDRLEYESLVMGIGLRYDYWFPGEQIERLYENYETLNRPTINAETRQEFLDDTHSLFGRRFKGHLSPRLQVSHPITERDKLFFNYGHFSQRPAYFYVYAKSSSQSSEEFPRIGNPNLNPEISVQYELGGAHSFRHDLAAKASLFYKDIYDYPTSTTLVLKERRTTRSNFFIYRNLDYARSTGIEVELRKSRFGHWSGAIAYTYSVAKGKSSDPNNLKLVQETGGDARETELGEIYMWWNRPHKVTAWYSLRYDRGSHPRLAGLTLPDDWNMNLYTLLQSGRAYTPETPAGERIGQEYSKNGPIETKTNLKFRKGFNLFGRRLEASLEIFNLFDHRTPLTFDYATGEQYEPGKGSLDSPYENPDNLDLPDEELIEAAGANVGPDQSVEEVADGIRRTITANQYRYSNPAYLSPPRSIRVGLGFEW
ncbi:MAG: TonB-dependent receptor [Candidatus Eisenbacteria bacterium]|nr:TonB-dependent receptor [Candidatus Latescibacterota bacterium]MBD3302760.1 TonB-dependent receptor [Candidatus Eisenbacteria bacterium]